MFQFKNSDATNFSVSPPDSLSSLELAVDRVVTTGVTFKKETFDWIIVDDGSKNNLLDSWTLSASGAIKTDLIYYGIEGGQDVGLTLKGLKNPGDKVSFSIVMDILKL